MIRLSALPRLQILLLIFGLLAVVQLGLAVAAFYQATHDDDRGFAFPGPDRVRAIVSTVDRIPAPLRNDLARALSDERLAVAILPADAILQQPDETQAMPGVERVIRAYLRTMGDREVIAWIAPDDEGAVTPPRMGPAGLWSRHPLRMAIELRTGDWLLIENRAHLAQSIFGFPPGFWAGIFGVTVAFASLWLLWRSLSPLGGLAAAMARFSAHPVAETLPAKGPEETRRIIEAVNRMQAEIAGFIADRQVMFGALSHDLRTILTRLALRVGELEDCEARDRAMRDVFAMNAIVEDALVLARLESCPPIAEARVGLQELLHELRCAYPAVPAQVEIAGGGGPEDIFLAGDGAELYRALQNLFENALAYAGGCEVSVSCTAKVCRFDVMDRGPGIAAGDRDRLTRPFVRGDHRDFSNRTGAGLGLAIVARTALRSGGEFELIGRDGGGLVARLTLARSN